MVQVLLRQVRLVHAREAVEEGRRADAIVEAVLLPELSVETHHKEFILKGEKSKGMMVLDDVKVALLELVKDLLVDPSGVYVGRMNRYFSAD